MSTTPRGERRRAEILGAAIALFGRHGYSGVSLASIAAEAGITETGLLHHFASKADLLVAVLEERDRRSKDELDPGFDRAGLGALAACEWLVEKNAEAPELVRLFTVLVGEAAGSETHPAHAHFAERYRTIAGRIRANLERGKASGEIAESVDTEQVARLLLAVMDGLQVQWLLDPELDMAKTFRLCTAALAHEIAVRS